MRFRSLLVRTIGHLDLRRGSGRMRNTEAGKDGVRDAGRGEAVCSVEGIRMGERPVRAGLLTA